ncbi:DUF2946 family protein [Variovorax sp. JS1663]|uniref:DUF2946 family protein n=1 Tax=Variovorax sp. JS1663 TaxID=1851577 RepID=UPI000B346401|nr:DUF2946 family protein [Variovorax sp. JS1663]OUM01020.1 hypothetical protein A8M77_18120 [Variovorax sp. JS1663]
MLRLRALLLWLFMLALPLQGYAAAAMVYCVVPVSAAAVAEMPAHADSHDHASHDHGTAMQQSRHDGTSHGAAGEPDEFHQCGTCAACHANAMVSALPVLPQSDLPQADLAASFVAPASPPLRVLDKPPRA